MTESPVSNLYGIYRDVLRDAEGYVIWDRGWRKNLIVTDCRRLLASFMRGEPGTSGISGLQVGSGSDTWDTIPQQPGEGDTSLFDSNPHTISLSASNIDFLMLDSDSISVTPTNRIQIQLSLGPNVPPWPDANHPTITLREFGLIGQINGSNILINYVIHPAIVKDPVSALERTIWLIF